MRMLTHPTAFLSRCSLRPLAAWPSLKTERSLFSIPACINTYSLITATRRNHRKSYTWGTHSRALGPWLSGRPAHSLRTLTTWKERFVFYFENERWLLRNVSTNCSFIFVLPVHRGGQLVLLLPWVLGRPEDSRKWSWESPYSGGRHVKNSCYWHRQGNYVRFSFC